MARIPIPIPLGHILRALVKPDSWIGRLLAGLEGVKITLPDGTEILLDTKPGSGPDIRQ